MERGVTAELLSKWRAPRFRRQAGARELRNEEEARVRTGGMGLLNSAEQLPRLSLVVASGLGLEEDGRDFSSAAVAIRRQPFRDLPDLQAQQAAANWREH